MPTKERLDKLLVTRGLCQSRQRAQAMIMAGNVLVNDERIDKAGTQVSVEAAIRFKQPPPRYVSRGGHKLEAALEAFSFKCEGLCVVDLGASTGGFTDCLLQHGATQVVAVDVGYGQLHASLRDDPRIHLMERTNARHLTPDMLPDDLPPVDLITGDLSFISLRLLIPAMASILRPGGELILLVKPQFEIGKDRLPKGAVVRNHDDRQGCADAVSKAAAAHDLIEQERIDSPTHGPKGNIEILMRLTKKNGAVASAMTPGKST